MHGALMHFASAGMQLPLIRQHFLVLDEFVSFVHRVTAVALKRCFFHHILSHLAACAMAGETVYADLAIPSASSSSRRAQRSQTCSLPQCPHWHRIALVVGWAGNVILVGAVVALGVWVFQLASQKGVILNDTYCDGASQENEDGAECNMNQPCDRSHGNSTDASSTLSVIPPGSPVHVIADQTAVLPISIQFHKQDWEFFHLKWEFVSGKCPILVLRVHQCTNAIGEWGKRGCEHSMEVTPSYQKRVDVSLQNPSLVIQEVKAKDAGRYRVTLRTNMVPKATAELSLTVTDG
ncbi:uncharacterized protein LOC135974915 [Chrysemys picta bellii]|uniref:uncharacterized protein LOC135974915 n=1 Tax=Chrysemys picta bellii TaxID=8478 RepID=UPI0032B22AD9